MSRFVRVGESHRRPVTTTGTYHFTPTLRQNLGLAMKVALERERLACPLSAHASHAMGMEVVQSRRGRWSFKCRLKANELTRGTVLEKQCLCKNAPSSKPMSGN